MKIKTLIVCALMVGIVGFATGQGKKDVHPGHSPTAARRLEEAAAHKRAMIREGAMAHRRMAIHNEELMAHKRAMIREGAMAHRRMAIHNEGLMAHKRAMIREGAMARRRMAIHNEEIRAHQHAAMRREGPRHRAPKH